MRRPPSPLQQRLTERRMAALKVISRIKSLGAAMNEYREASEEIRLITGDPDLKEAAVNAYVAGHLYQAGIDLSGADFEAAAERGTGKGDGFAVWTDIQNTAARVKASRVRIEELA